MTGRTDKNLYIIGAGFAGQMLAEEIARKKIFGNVIAFLDDDDFWLENKVEVQVAGFKNNEIGVVYTPFFS